ncbi:hypothetical protein D3C84_92460 [compost metagenome]
MSQASTADQHVRRVRVIEGRQDAQLREQFGVVVADAEAEDLHLLFQRVAGFDGGERQIAHAARV